MSESDGECPQPQNQHASIDGPRRSYQGAGIGAGYSMVLPDTLSGAGDEIQPKQTRGRNSLPWSRGSQRGLAVSQQERLHRRSLGSMGSVCNAATIHIPEISFASRLSMESTMSNMRNSISEFPFRPSLVENALSSGSLSVDSFNWTIRQLLDKLLGDITDEYAQRVASLQQPEHDSNPSVQPSAGQIHPPVGRASEVAAPPPVPHSAPPPLPMAAVNKRPVSAPRLHQASTHNGDGDRAAKFEEKPSWNSEAGIVAKPKPTSRPAASKKWKRAETAPALPLEDEDDTNQRLTVPKAGGMSRDASNRSLEDVLHSHSTGSGQTVEDRLARHHDATDAIFHHGHLDIPKSFASSNCPSSRGSFMPHEGMLSLSARSSARGSKLNMQDLTQLPSAILAAHGHREYHASHMDTISGSNLHSMAQDTLGARYQLGNSLEAELDAVLAAQSPFQAPVRPRASFEASSSQGRPQSPKRKSNVISAEADFAALKHKEGKTRTSVEAELDSVFTGIQRGSMAFPADDLEVAPPRLVPDAGNNKLLQEPTQPDSDDRSSYVRISPSYASMQALGPSGLIQSSADGNGDDEGDETMEKRLTNTSSRSSHTHIFEVLGVFETRQKSLRLTRNVTSALNFGFQDSDADEDMSDDEDQSFVRRCYLSQCTIRSNHMVKIFWDMLGFVLISYDFVMIPMQFFDPEETPFLQTMVWLVRVYWTCDFPLSMVSAYELPSGVQERRLGKVVMHYVKTWAGFDVCILALDYLENAVEGLSGLGAARAGKIGKSVRLLRMFRVLRMLRRNTLPEPMKQLSYKLQSEQYMILFGIWRIIVGLLGAVHLIACCWYGVGSGASSSWVYFYSMDETGLDWSYTSSFHWSLTQFAGSMDIQPQNVGDRLFAIFALIVGFLISACVVSSITSSMTRLQIVLAHESTQKSLLSNYLCDNGISTKLALRVQRNAIYAYQQDKKNLPESSIELLQLVSEPLRVELHYEMFMPVLTAHPFFQLYNQMSPSGMRNICHVAMCRIQLASGDMLFTAGETPQTPWMYFLTNGLMAYLQEHTSPGSKAITVTEGSWCCEPVLWTQWVHHGTMRAKTEITLMGLRAASFQEISCRFQAREFTPKSYADEYVSHLNNLEEAELTDLAESTADILEYCQRALQKCSLRSQQSMRSVASCATSSSAGGLNSRHTTKTFGEQSAPITDLNGAFEKIKRETLQRSGSKKSIASSVASMASMFRFNGRSDTNRSLSMYSNRSTTRSNRSTTRSTTKGFLNSRSRSRMSISPAQGNSPMNRGGSNSPSIFTPQGSNGDDGGEPADRLNDMQSSDILPSRSDPQLPIESIRETSIYGSSQTVDLAKEQMSDEKAARTSAKDVY